MRVPTGMRDISVGAPDEGLRSRLTMHLRAQ